MTIGKHDTYHSNIEQETLTNEYFRKVLYTGKHMQLVVMSIPPAGEIGLEIHDHVDQFFRVESGEAEFIINKHDRKKVIEDEVFIVPAGTYHNIMNTSKTDDLKLYTIYAPPNHPDGKIHKTKEEADADEHDHYEGH